MLRSDRLFADTEPSASVAQCIPDLLDGSCDSSILAVSSLPDSDAVLVRLGSTYDVLCASPAYLSTHDMPAEPTDLLSHECLTLNTPTFPQREWDFDGPKGKKSLTIDSVLQFDNAEALAAAIRHGNGIGALPVHAALAGFGDGSLARVLRDHTVGSREICAVHPSRRYVDARTRTWLDLMRAYLPLALERDHAELNDLNAPALRQTIVEGRRDLTRGAALTH